MMRRRLLPHPIARLAWLAAWVMLNLGALTGAAAAAPSSAPPSQAAPTQADPLALAHTERFKHLAAELRCLVCQNQTLADSNAELAVDLRNEVLRLMARGHDDEAIKAHLAARYGEFVLYRPRFSLPNLALWLTPAAALLLGFLMLRRLTRTPVPAPPNGHDAAQQLATLLDPPTDR